MTRLSPLLLILILMTAPALALPARHAADAGSSPIKDYVRARVADAQGNLDAAAAGYAAALTARPDDAALALRAYRQAIFAGDHALASRAAGVLARAQAVPPDARLLLLTDAVDAGDWKTADAEALRIQKDDVFAFAVPMLRAWIALGAGPHDGGTHDGGSPGGAGDPLVLIEVGRTQALASAYVPEQRALLLLALGRTDDGITALRALGATGIAGDAANGGARAVRMKLIAAAALQKARRRDEAAAMLAGDDPTLIAARALLADGRAIPAAVRTPADGMAELFARIALDINHERVTPLALTLARIATFLAPDNAETWLVTGELLGGAQQPAAALAAIAHVAPDDPFAEGVRATRLQLLVAQGETRTALAEAQAIAGRPGAAPEDWTRIGDLQANIGDQQAAVAAYAHALAIAEADPAARPDLWNYLLMLGSAQEQAGAWPDARATLTRALTLAPAEPAVLNYLGYAQLSRRENLPVAERLIARASALRPADAAITDSLGWAYYVQGDIPKAIATLERAVAGDPGEPTVNEHLGDAYWSAGRRVEARYAWAAALVRADTGAARRIHSKIDDGLSGATAAP